MTYFPGESYESLPSFCVPESTWKNIARQRVQLFERMAQTPSVWSDDLKFESVLVIDGSTYSPPQLFPCKPVPLRTGTESKHYVRCGDWGYRNVILPRGEWILTMCGRERGRVAFTTDVVVPALWKNSPSNVWMSLTPMEFFSCRSGIRFAKGRVVVGGLGLGHMLKEICAKKSVTEVIVVEKSQELLDWFGNKLCAAQPKVTKIFCGDVLKYIGLKQKELLSTQTRVTIDIWDGYGGNGDEREIREAEYAGVRVWSWGKSFTRG